MRSAIALAALVALGSSCSRRESKEGLRWSTDETAALARAKAERKPVLIDFGARWCMPCTEYEQKTFTDPAVIERLSKMVLLRFDVTEQSEADEALMERYRATMLPTLIGLSPDGAEKVRITKFLGPDAFLRALSGLE